MELADGRVSEPNSTWKVVARETSKETPTAGDSFVPRAPLRKAPGFPSASDGLWATAESKKFNLRAFVLGLLLFSQLDLIVLSVIGTPTGEI